MSQQAHAMAQRGARACRRGGESKGNARGMGGEGARTFGGRTRARRSMEQAHKQDGSTQKEAWLLTQVLHVSVPHPGTNGKDKKKHGDDGDEHGSRR